MALDISNMLSKNVILVDTNYIGYLASDFASNFERMLMREIPKADLALWLECLALDGGIQPGENDIQVIFIYDDKEFKCFAPSNLKEEIDGKAFRSNLGEFCMEAYQVAKDVTTVGEQFAETLRVLLDAESVEKILAVPNMNTYGDAVEKLLNKNEKKQATLFSIQPIEGKGYENQQLGFSVVHALGIHSDELQG